MRKRQTGARRNCLVLNAEETQRLREWFNEQRERMDAMEQLVNDNLSSEY